MLLNHSDNYLSDGGRTLILGQTKYSGGGGVSESLANELNFFVALVSSIVSPIAACTPNLRQCRKVRSTSMVQVVLGRSLSSYYFTRFSQHWRHLVKNSKIHGLELTQILSCVSCQT